MRPQKNNSLPLCLQFRRKCAKLFFELRSASKQAQIVNVLCSYLEHNKQKMTDWLKQLFHCIIPEDALKNMSFYFRDETGTSDYNRWMVYLINKYAMRSQFDDEETDDSPHGIVQSTFYGESMNAVLRKLALDGSKKSVSEWQLIHSSDNEDDQDQGDDAPVAVPSILTELNAKLRRFSKSKCTVFQAEQSPKANESPVHQSQVCLEEKPNRKRKSAQIAVDRVKKQLIDAAIDVVEVKKDVYDYDEDDNEPMLKKKRQVAQPKKRKKPASFPRVKIEQMKEEERPEKLYTIRVKKPVGAQAKAMAGRVEKPMEQVEKSTKLSKLSIPAVKQLVHSPEYLVNEAEWSMNELEIPVNEPKKSINETKNASKFPDVAVEPSMVKLSIHSPEILVNDADWSMNELEIPVIKSKKTVKTTKKAAQTSKTPMAIPKEIFANIEKINATVNIDTNNRSDRPKTKCKSRTKNTIAVNSLKKPEPKKKVQPRELYTEPDPEFDDIVLLTTTNKTEIATTTETATEVDQTDAAKNQVDRSARETDTSLNTSFDDDLVTNTTVSIKIDATSSCRTPSIESKANCDTLQSDSIAMPDSTNDLIGITDVEPFSTGMDFETMDASDDSYEFPSHPDDSSHSLSCEIIEQLKIASSAMCRILSVLDQSTRNRRYQGSPHQQRLMQ
ncbi:uncharacterized protein LOC129568185 isoform X2 [Sitodiplosis mosellana]|uniref:uncharacterized protein LOC129568185 isoform X2 n=1 Tax=Sitodiplosis mosellana TaxID=263140 RepID=UPI002444299B|nr:uncharacterized protein LOC129568185 isoform X2 [Sitodiplosis mosellana]